MVRVEIANLQDILNTIILYFFRFALLGEKVRITGIGSVGIGITNPDQELHVIGQIKVSDSMARTKYARNNTNLWSVD